MRLARLYAILVAVLAILEGGGMNTRKQFLRDGFGLAAILSAQTAPAILVRSMVAARNGIAAAKRGWVNPYVTDGLVAMWDGEWNVGGGVHDTGATSWKNLVGSVDAINQTSTNINWSSNALVFQDNLHLKVDSLFDRPQQITIEVCHNAKGVAGKRYGALFSSVEAGGVGIQQKAAESTWTFQCGNPSGGYYGVLDVSDFEDTASTLAGRVGDYMSTFKNGVENNVGSETTGIRYNYKYYQIGRDTGDSGNIVGPIYSIRFYNRALTAEEIAWNCEIDRRRFNQT